MWKMVAGSVLSRASEKSFESRQRMFLVHDIHFSNTHEEKSLTGKTAVLSTESETDQSVLSNSHDIMSS
jgi:hypothetical protein